MCVAWAICPVSNLMCGTELIQHVFVAPCTVVLARTVAYCFTKRWAEPWIYVKTGDGMECDGTAAEGHYFPVAGTPKPDADGSWASNFFFYTVNSRIVMGYHRPSHMTAAGGGQSTPSVSVSVSVFVFVSVCVCVSVCLCLSLSRSLAPSLPLSSVASYLYYLIYADVWLHIPMTRYITIDLVVDTVCWRVQRAPPYRFGLEVRPRV